jgi:hypothetical protein
MAKKVRPTSSSSNKNLVSPIKRDGGQMNPLLWDILSVASPSGEEKVMFPLMPKGAFIDKLGNHIYHIGKAEEHQTMFSCHIDTVQRKTGVIIPHMDKNMYVWGIKEGEHLSTILGADDKVGVYLMMQMMKERIPGLYVFHIGEECGGKGSEGLVQAHPEFFTHIKRCIAFDRKDVNDVITHQRGHTRGCSDEFATALCDELNKYTAKSKPAMPYKPCDGGTFTDSANYWHLIPECTNISIGYYDNHGDGEYFDLWFVESLLLPAVKKVNWYRLPTKRAIDESVRPAYAKYVSTPYTNNTSYSHNYGKRNYRGEFNFEKGDDLPPFITGTNKNSSALITKEAADNIINLGESIQKNIRKDFVASCKRVSPATPITEVPIYSPFVHGVLEGVSEMQHKLLIQRQNERQSTWVVAEWVVKYMKNHNGAIELLKQAKDEKDRLISTIGHMGREIEKYRDNKATNDSSITVIEGEPVNKKIKKLRKARAGLMAEIEVKNAELTAMKKKMEDVEKKMKSYSSVMEMIVIDRGQEYVTSKFLAIN